MDTLESSFVRDSSFRSQTTLNSNLNISDLSGHSRRSDFITYDSLRKQALARRVLFEDPEFPSNDKSLQLGLRQEHTVEWKRPHALSKRPKFTGSSPDPTDVVPGQFGTSCLFPALSCLSLAPALLQRCIPADQAFDEQYGGIFRFRFWRFGEWVEICIDDRLPTLNGKLMFMRNGDPNEFWAGLLEKAYAKLYGSYAAIQTPNIMWTLQDVTGGVTDTVVFRDNPAMMRKIVDLAMARNSLIAATTPQPPGQPLKQLSNGLVPSRSYTVTGYAEIPVDDGSAILVRLRNPWRTPQWQGSWDHSSTLWLSIQDDIKAKLGYGSLAEGEFWMPFQEFSRQFTMLEICHLPPGTWHLEPKLKHRLPWKSIEAHRQWRRGFNAGGGPGSPLLSCNSQFYIEVSRPCCVVLSLMQKYRLCGEQREFVPCGMLIYQCPQGRTTRLQTSNLLQARMVACTGVRAERDIVRFCQLPAGAYVILPVTSQPGLEGRFYLRIYTDERCTVARELDDPDTMSLVQTERQLDVDILSNLRRRFLIASNTYEEIDAYDLQEMLSTRRPNKSPISLCCGLNRKGSKASVEKISLSPETCKAAVTIVDKNMNGRLTYEEFMSLLQKLVLWQAVFRRYSADKGMTMDSYALRNALRIVGFSVSNRTLEALVLRYASRDTISLDGFVNAAIKLHVAHQRNATPIEGMENIGERERKKYLQELLRATIYS